MRANRILNGSTRVAVVAIVVVIILLPLGYSVVSSAFSQGAPLPEESDGDYCLGDVPLKYMRFHHMDLLKEVRDEIVREGSGEVEFYGELRKVELDDCRECHPSREEFCNRCHDPVTLYPDCFRCHEYP